MLAIELDQAAARGEPGQLLEQQAALAPAGQRELADQLLVPGLLACGEAAIRAINSRSVIR